MKNDPNGGREPFFRRVILFLGDRGFYIVLFLCVAVIGMTAWLFSTAWDTAKPLEEDLTVSQRVTAPPLETGSHSDSLTSGDFRWLPQEQLPQEQLPQTEPPLAQHPQAEPPVTAPPADAVDIAAGQQPNAETGAAGDGGDAVAAEADDSGKPAAEAMATVFLWPVTGEVAAEYSVETLRYDRTMADWRTHAALDIAAPLGGKVSAAADGTVERVHTDQRYGVTVTIYHGGGLRSLYANLAGTPTVQAGDEVRLGDVIGAVGDTAMAEAGDVTHLHFSMTLDGKSVNPADYLPQKK